MSYWTYVSGIITVFPMGRTQPEKRYILDTALEHLPKVTGSEQDMHVHVIQKHGYNGSCSHNEFGEWIPNEEHHTQDYYFLVVEGSLRDRMFDGTKRELNKWLNRLAKRVGITEILVRLEGQGRELIISNSKPYEEMAEWPAWSDKSDGKPMWCEYLMWERTPDSMYPLLLTRKYYNVPEVDAEIERRAKFKLD